MACVHSFTLQEYKEFAPLGSIFSFKSRPLFRRKAQNFERVTSPESVSIPLKLVALELNSPVNTVKGLLSQSD